MIPLLSAEEMRAFEQESIRDWGISSLVLQEHAAKTALELIPRNASIHVLAGPGNNGGDALALARLAKLRGEPVEVWTLFPAPEWSGDAAVQARLWEGLGLGYHHSVHVLDTVSTFNGWVVDGLFGLGSRLPLREPALSWVQALNQVRDLPDSSRRFKVLALDLPTGLDPSSPEAHGPVIRADTTACFGHLKICHGFLPACTYCGEIIPVPIPLRGQPRSSIYRIEEGLPTKSGRWDSHKSDFGHVGIRAGKKGMSGAAVLAALGALRTGAGLVTVLPDPDAHLEVACQVPEAMVRPWDGTVPKGIDVLLVGPGGVSEIPEWEGLLVLDASALKPGEGPRWMNRPLTVITPHSGEFSRLFSLEPPLAPNTTARLQAVKRVGTGPGVLALKGAQSLIAGGWNDTILMNPTGHVGLSTGGTGDFLAGMVAAILAIRSRTSCSEGSSLLWMREAVSQALWMHGRAADNLGHGPILVRDLAESLRSMNKVLI